MIEQVYEAFMEEYQIQQITGFCTQEIEGYSGFVFSSSNCTVTLPVEVNRAIHLVLSGVGNKRVDVSFIDKNGTEQTVTLTDLSRSYTQLEAFRAYRHFEKLGDEDEYQSFPCRFFCCF